MTPDDRRHAGYPPGDIDIDFPEPGREPASPSRFGPDFEPDCEEWHEY